MPLSIWKICNRIKTLVTTTPNNGSVSQAIKHSGSTLTLPSLKEIQKTNPNPDKSNAEATKKSSWMNRARTGRCKPLNCLKNRKARQILIITAAGTDVD